MGEIADMAVNGECCQICFAHFPDEALGYPYTCPECQGETAALTSRRRKKDRIPCPNCGRMIARVGMAQHCEAVHPTTLLLTAMGYMELREVEDWGMCGIGRMMFTCGVCYGMDATGMRGRFCFDTYQNASLFLKDWGGKTLPEVGIDGCTAIK